jgi:hypothetical protein
VSARRFGKCQSAVTLLLGKSLRDSTRRELAEPVHFCVPPVGFGFEKVLGRRLGLAPPNERWRHTLRTIRDACDYMTAVGKKRELLTHWQRVAKGQWNDDDFDVLADGVVVGRISSRYAEFDSALAAMIGRDISLTMLAAWLEVDGHAENVIADVTGYRDPRNCRRIVEGLHVKIFRPPGKIGGD